MTMSFSLQNCVDGIWKEEEFRRDWLPRICFQAGGGGINGGLGLDGQWSGNWGWGGGVVVGVLVDWNWKQLKPRKFHLTSHGGFWGEKKRWIYSGWDRVWAAEKVRGRRRWRSQGGERDTDGEMVTDRVRLSWPFWNLDRDLWHLPRKRWPYLSHLGTCVCPCHLLLVFP